MQKIKKLVRRSWPTLRKIWDIVIYWLCIFGSVASLLSLFK